MRRIVLLILLAAFIGTPASAQGILSSNASEDATEANSQPKLARDASGTIYVAYVAPSGGVPQIYLARSSDGGTRWQTVPVTSSRARPATRR